MQPPLAARIARRAYRALRRSPLAAVVNLPVARAMRRRLEGMRSADVLAVLDAFEAAGIRCWVVGGWGVDALLGKKTRHHEDLDLAVEVDTDLPFEEQPARAQRVLEELGFAFVEHNANAAIWMPTHVLLRDPIGRSIDLLPAAYDPARAGQPALPGASAFAFGDETFTEGSIAGRTVPCMAAATQITFHGGYPIRPVDRDDISRLCDRFDLPLPAGSLEATAIDSQSPG